MVKDQTNGCILNEKKGSDGASSQPNEEGVAVILARNPNVRKGFS